MRIGMIGTGRMGRILAERMATVHEVVLYDADPAVAQSIASSMGVGMAESLAKLDVEAVVLAVPDDAVETCVKALRAAEKRLPLFNVATNISREMLASFDGSQGCCLNVKIIGHAGEMSRGARPILVVDGSGFGLGEMACRIFAPVGDVVVGEADKVKQINCIATEAALKAGVALEQSLQRAGVSDVQMIRAALSLVATGVLRAYAEDDLGPFARGIVKALRDKSDG